MTNDDIARAILDGASYVVLATADTDGVPWASPVWFAMEGYRELYWVSYPGARHSENIAVRPQIAMVVFDSTVPPGTGQGAYMTATAEQLTDLAAIEHGLGVFSRESCARGTRSGGSSGSPATRGCGFTGRPCTTARSSTQTSRWTYASKSDLDRAAPSLPATCRRVSGYAFAERYHSRRVAVDGDTKPAGPDQVHSPTARRNHLGQLVRGGGQRAGRVGDRSERVRERLQRRQRGLDRGALCHRKRRQVPSQFPDALGPDVLENLCAVCGQAHKEGSFVGRVVAAFDEAGLGDHVQQPGCAGHRDVQLVGQVADPQRAMLAQDDQRR